MVNLDNTASMVWKNFLADHLVRPTIQNLSNSEGTKVESTPDLQLRGIDLLRKIAVRAQKHANGFWGTIEQNGQFR